MKKSLIDFMAEACHYAQEHVGDKDSWSMSQEDREIYFNCVSYQMACFLAQNTVRGDEGVEWEFILDDLVERNPPVKSIVAWKKILNNLAKKLGGWKRSFT